MKTSGTKAADLGLHNPLRYRGYVYDTETGLYYLQSRYYNPTLGRFLSSDIVYDTDAGLQGFNLFLYCGNNPTNRIDASGKDSKDLIDGDKEKETQLAEGGASNSHTPTGTIIYRYGGTNPGNLTPRSKDVSGLSFSTEYKNGSATTTIEEINSTGILKAVQDGPNHVSVFPVNASMNDWIMQGRNSVWTIMLKSIVRKV